MSMGSGVNKKDGEKREGTREENKWKTNTKEVVKKMRERGPSKGQGKRVS